MQVSETRAKFWNWPVAIYSRLIALQESIEHVARDLLRAEVALGQAGDPFAAAGSENLVGAISRLDEHFLTKIQSDADDAEVRFASAMKSSVVELIRQAEPVWKHPPLTY